MPSRTAAAASFLPELPSGSRLLVIRMRSLGDALLVTPALRALKQWRPDLRLSMLLYKPFAPIVAGNADLEEVIEFDPRGPRAPLRLGRVLSEVRRRPFAACFNLHGGTLSALLTRLSGAPHRVGFNRSRFRFAYTTVADPRAVFGRDRLHTVENQIGLFYGAGLPQGEIPPLRVFPQPAARQAVVQKLAARGVPAGARYAVIHPTANFFTKEWPFERYAALAGYLENQHGLTPVFTCGLGEEAKLEVVARAASKALVRLYPLTVPELVAALEGAALFVGNDSGPTHIAAALGRPVVVLFGSSDSVSWSPWRAPHALVQNYYPCNPCRGDRCYAFAEPQCILSLTLEQVQTAVERVLAAVPSTVS